jgi:hypothetical protein
VNAPTVFCAPRNVKPAPDLFPSGIDSYPDVIQFWLAHPLNARERRSLRGCLRVTGGHLLEPRNEPAWWNPALRQRVRICQPSHEAVKLLLDLRGDSAYLNYAEEALDWIFYRPAKLQEARVFTDRHLVKPNHRQESAYYRGTLYSNRRWAPTNLVVYHTRPSKRWGEPCVHLEYRLAGNPALTRANLATFADWLNLDEREFWRERLYLCDVDLARLGRLLHNQETGKHRRGGWEYDRLTGFHAFAGVDRSVQKLIDTYRRQIDVHSCLIEYDNTELLPDYSSQNNTRLLYDCIPSAELAQNSVQAIEMHTHE